MLQKCGGDIRFTITLFVVTVGSDKPVELAYVKITMQDRFLNTGFKLSLQIIAQKSHPNVVQIAFTF